MAEKEPRLQGEEDEFVSSVYLLGGKMFLISKEGQEAIDAPTGQLKEALPDTGQRATNMERIVDRVQTLMATNFRDIKSTKKLRDKVKGLRTNPRPRIMELSSKILPMLEERSPAREDVADMINTLNDSNHGTPKTNDGRSGRNPHPSQGHEGWWERSGYQFKGKIRSR